MKLLAYLLLVPTIAASEQPPNTKTPSNGRYQLVQLSEFRRDRFLIDTQTGRMWMASCEVPGEGQVDCKYQAWFEEDVVGLNTTLAKVTSAIKAIKGGGN
jgi:hypothetical protein